MIKVIVELHPFGDSDKKEVIEEFTITNKGTGDRETGNYAAHFHGGTSVVHVDGHVRRHGVLHLIKKCIQKLYLEV